MSSSPSSSSSSLDGAGRVSAISILPAPSIQLARALESTSVQELQSMTPYELFQKQVESGSTEASLDAVKRLSVVAITMGPEQIRDDLLPYLTSLVNHVASHSMTVASGASGGPAPALSDEWLMLLGQELKWVAQFYLQTNHNSQPGNNNKFQVEDFLPILERLAAVEETVVREQAVTVFGELAQSASAGSAPVWMALLKRLVNADWFTPKVSAAGILPHLFRIVTDAKTATPPQQQTQQQQHPAALELIALYKELCTDETPMVRRAAAQHLGHALAQSGWIYRDEGLAIQTLTRLCHDEQDSVRRLAVVALADATQVYANQSPAWTAQHWLPLLKEASTDLSWRVRHNLSKNFSDVAANIGVNKDRRLTSEQALVMACFVTVLTDVEAEVRAAAITHFARMVTWGGQALFLTHLQPLLPALADDVVMEVRTKCALALMDAAHGGALEDSVILQAMGPLFEAFLQDEFHEVQLQVLGNLHKIAHLLPGLGGVVSTLLSMAKATNWRVRQAVAQLLPHLAEARGLDFFLQALLEPAWMPLLLDSVASVRLAIVQGMPLLVKVAGEEWIIQVLLPHHMKIFHQSASSYLMRITLLQGFILAATVARGPLLPEVISIVVKCLSNDKVPNVRMVAAKGLQQILVSDNMQDEDPGKAIVVSIIRPALVQKLAAEDDVDVRRACQIALDRVSVK